MSSANISPDSLDRYFDRQEHLDKARTGPCPECKAEPSQPCQDRWDLPTSLVHAARHTDGYTDGYSL